MPDNILELIYLKVELSKPLLNIRKSQINLRFGQHRIIPFRF